MSESQEIMYCSNCSTLIEDPSLGYCPNCGQGIMSFFPEQPESTMLAVNSSLNGGRFSVGDCLNTGSFNMTYVGFDFSSQNKVFIKETFYNGLFTRSGSNAQYPAEFPFADIQRNAQKQCLSLSGTKGLGNINSVIDWFQENNTFYIVTEYVEGTTLKDWVEGGGRFTWNELYRKMKPIMAGLANLHAKGIFHRDINPSNIIVRSSDMEFVLTNISFDRSTDPRILSYAGNNLATGYAPYEQIAFTAPDADYTDVYAIAAVMYYAMTGEAPSPQTYDTVAGNFPRIEMLASHYGVPENVVNGFKKALEPYVEQRCQSMSELVRALDDGETRMPHYLYGRPENAPESKKRDQSKSRQQIKSEYYERLVEKQKEDERQQMEINSTLAKLFPKYARRVASYDRSIISMKGLIIPAVFVALIVFLVFMSNRS